MSSSNGLDVLLHPIIATKFGMVNAPSAQKLEDSIEQRVAETTAQTFS